MTLPLASYIPRARLAGRFGPQAAATVLLLLAGCAHVGRLNYVGHTVSPAPADTTEQGDNETSGAMASWRPLFGADSLAWLQAGTADSSTRYLGRLRDGYTADTLNIILCGDNRPDTGSPGSSRSF
jgi:hypothetical protein